MSLPTGRPRPKTYSDTEAIARRLAQAQRAVSAGRHVHKNSERVGCLRAALEIIQREKEAAK